MPGARCTRGLVCNSAQKKRTRAYRYRQNTPAFPAQWLYGLCRAPRRRIRLASVVGELAADRTLSGVAATTAALAGLLNGVTPLTATTGSGATALLGDIKKLVAAIAPALRPVLIANSTATASIGVLAQASLPVITAPTMPADQIIAVDVAAFASAIGVPSFRASQNVTLHMDSAPTALSATGSPNTVAAPMRSAFQSDVTALRSIVPIDWALRRAHAVAVINGTTW